MKHADLIPAGGEYGTALQAASVQDVPGASFAIPRIYE
jgi:hypothetical protein